MNINDPNVKFSSIVDIGEKVQKLELDGDKFLKLHRGIMDVTNIDLSFINLDLNMKSTHQYGSNDGDPNLINSIKSYYNLDNHDIIICPGGMSTIDIVVNSLSDITFWVPKYHWGSWNKILKIHNKDIQFFDEFDLSIFRPTRGVVMMCYPSNPTGWIPDMNELCDFVKHCSMNNITVVLDLPYYHLFFSPSSISNLFLENVIVVSSFSKSIGLSGYRIGYIATLNKNLYRVLHIRSLYKYNSISNIPQYIINQIISTSVGRIALSNYQDITKLDISKNIRFLKENNLLWKDYPSDPLGPFCIIDKEFNDLMSFNISSVPLNKFTLTGDRCHHLSRISVSVPNSDFVKYFDMVLGSVNASKL